MNNLEDFSNWLQIFSFLILVKDFNNTDLMKYLEHQDNIMNKIIQQNEEIKKSIEQILKNMSK